MSIVIAGVVTHGVIVPREPLPEGAQVEIHLTDPPIEVPPELQEELTAWQQASANALAMVERLAEEGDASTYTNRVTPGMATGGVGSFTSQS